MNEYKRKLTDTQVETIRYRAARGIAHRLIAEQFNIDQSQISRIATGHLYINAPGPITKARYPGPSLGSDTDDPMFWYACQGLPFEKAVERYRVLQRRRKVAA